MAPHPIIWPNLIVAASNVLGIPGLLSASGWHHRLVTLLVMVASTLMHLSETKHSLVGIRPLNRWSSLFLNLDRLMAVLALAFYACTIPLHVWHQALPIGLFGLLMSALSEWVEGGYVWFTITHCLWHISVYYLMFIFGQQ